jgi:signal transduction histidine kinase
MLFAQYNMIVSQFQVCLFLMLFFLKPDITIQKQHLPREKSVEAYEKLILKFRYSKPDSAAYYGKQGLEYFRKNKDLLGEAKMLNQLGMIDDNFGYFDESREKYLKALEIFKRLNVPQGVIKLNVRLGVVENRKGNYPKAISYFFQALNVSEKSNDNAGKLESYITIGEVYAHQKNYKVALDYYNKAIGIKNKLPLSNITLNLYNDLGACYREMKVIQLAKFYYEKGISLSNTPEYMGLHISMITGLAMVYYDAGDVKKAITLHKEALTKSREIHNFIREILSLKGLSDSYSASNPKLAMDYLQQALILAKEKKANKIVLEVLNGIAKLQSENNNFKQAYLTKVQQYNIADSFYFKDISEKISSLQSQNELSKSQSYVQRLRYLNSKQTFERKVLMWVLICSFLVITILGLYFIKIRNLNRLLNKANNDLTDLNQVKDKLFSVLGHDLRSPLTSITNVLYLINEGMLDEEEQKVIMKKLAVTCNASMETLDMLLKWGQMQLRGVKINKTVFSPQDVIERNIRLLSRAAEEKSILIVNEIIPSLIVEVDADHFDFIFRNLLSNAIKFTPNDGKIILRSRLDSDPYVQFEISDNGVGISIEKHESIFEVDNISAFGTNNEKGNSLGLVICKEFIEANGGDIWVESAPGKGSTFFFTVVIKSNVAVPGAFELDIL